MPLPTLAGLCTYEDAAHIGYSVDDTVRLLVRYAWIEKRAMDTGRREGFDVVILDTAGRLQIDDALMDQLVQLRERIGHAALSGLSATIHAIGDKANHKALNALSEARKLPQKDTLRHRIEHAQIPLPEDRKRFRELDVIASMQPMHIVDDVRIADKYLGSRAANAYPVNAYLQEGVRVVFGSDMPVADPDPLKGMLAAVARRYRLDPAEPVWYPEHCISPLQALVAYTREAAFASYEETVKGTLEAGKLADFVVLSGDVLQGGEDAFYTAEPVMTVLAGKCVYRSEV